MRLACDKDLERRRTYCSIEEFSICRAEQDENLIFKWFGSKKKFYRFWLIWSREELRIEQDTDGV